MFGASVEIRDGATFSRTLLSGSLVVWAFWGLCCVTLFLAMDTESGKNVCVKGIHNAARAPVLSIHRGRTVSHFSTCQASMDVVASPSSRVEVVDAAG